MVAGLAAALIGARVLQSLLFEVPATDVPTLAGASLLFACLALVACWILARRAARVDPLAALREG